MRATALATAALALAPGAGEAVPTPQQLVFTTDRHAQPPSVTTNLELYVLDVDRGALRRLTRSPATDEQPSWSRDGTRIAFVRSVVGDAGVFVVNANGTATRRLSPRPAQDGAPSWSPDGRRLAFVRGGDLWTMRADGRDARRLTRGPANDGASSWSPDGRRLVFWSETGGDTDLYVVRSDGSGRRRLTSGPGNDLAPAWSPDGLRIAFTSNRDAGGNPSCAGPWEIYAADLGGGGVRRLTENDAYDWTSAGSWGPSAR